MLDGVGKQANDDIARLSLPLHFPLAEDTTSMSAGQPRLGVPEVRKVSRPQDLADSLLRRHDDTWWMKAISLHEMVFMGYMTLHLKASKEQASGRRQWAEMQQQQCTSLLLALIHGFEDFSRNEI